MATITRTTVWVDGNTLTAAALNGEFNNSLNALSLVNSDVSGSAAIALSKLAGSSQGAVPYDNGSSLSTLAPGTSGQFLQTQGAGQNPQWATLASNSSVASDSTTQSLTGSPVQIGALSVTITATGKPCLVVAQVGLFDSGISSPALAQFTLVLDGATVLTSVGYVWSGGTRRVSIPFVYLSTPAAGSHTWVIKGTASSAISSDGTFQGPNYLTVHEIH